MEIIIGLILILTIIITIVSSIFSSINTNEPFIDITVSKTNKLINQGFKNLLYADRGDFGILNDSLSSTSSDAYFIVHDAVYFDRVEKSPFKKILCVIESMPKYFTIVANSTWASGSFVELITRTNPNVICLSPAAKEIFIHVTAYHSIDISTLYGKNLDRIKVETDLNNASKAFNDLSKKTIIVSLEYGMPSQYQWLVGKNAVQIDVVGGMDMKKIPLTLPYLKFSMIDLNTLFQNAASSTASLTKVLTIDSLVYTVRNDTSIEMRSIIINELFSNNERKRNAIINLNFYKRLGFLVFDDDNVSKYVVESFLNTVQFTPDMPVNDAFINRVVRNAFKEMILRGDRIQGIRLVRGDKITLINQRNTIENDSYTVIQTAPDESILHSAIYIQWDNNAIEFTRAKDARGKYVAVVKTDQHPAFTSIYNDLYEIGSRVYLDNVDLIGSIISIDKNAKKLVVGLMDELESENEKYVCSDTPEYKTKETCEAQVDNLGNRKKRNIWDRPCQWDSECPFFKWYTGVKGYRGGCSNGYCEMPIGVNRIAYRKYEQSNTSFPYCHNCNIRSMKECCEKNKEYAFELDF